MVATQEIKIKISEEDILPIIKEMCDQIEVLNEEVRLLVHLLPDDKIITFVSRFQEWKNKK